MRLRDPVCPESDLHKAAKRFDHPRGGAIRLNQVEAVDGALAKGSAMLARIDSGTDLWHPDAAAALRGAEAMWEQLRTLLGVEWVTAGKLLARKRPRLVPVADRVVLGALAPPRHKFWVTLGECLTRPDLRQQIEDLRPANAESVSLLRLLDVAIWMRYSGSGSAKAVRRRLGIE